MHLSLVNLTDYQRLKHDQFHPQETLISIEELIKETISAYKVVVEQNGVDITFSKGS